MPQGVYKRTPEHKEALRAQWRAWIARGSPGWRAGHRGGVKGVHGGNKHHPTGCMCPFCGGHGPGAAGENYHSSKLLTDLALDLAGALLVAGYELVPEVCFGRYRVDFYEPNRHLAFEADSDYWHAPLWRREHDAKRDTELLNSFGLPVIRITQEEIQRLVA
jgi:hypothetical protein